MKILEWSIAIGLSLINPYYGVAAFALFQLLILAFESGSQQR